ncbi:unnamed protein product [Rhizoctonia solani]|uniref:Uncharacterized protein n=1 Tax=Rhizoctonia solani TaxID=456999 RepID=A0A8H3HW10_9AGAM|nr:unnamed protein product [Rhizoctonia solani]
MPTVPCRSLSTTLHNHPARPSLEGLSGCIYVASSCSLCTCAKLLSRELVPNRQNLRRPARLFIRVHPYGQLDTSHRAHNRVPSSRVWFSRQIEVQTALPGGRACSWRGIRKEGCVGEAKRWANHRVGKPSTKANPGRLFAQPEFSLAGLVSALGARASRTSHKYADPRRNRNPRSVGRLYRPDPSMTLDDWTQLLDPDSSTLARLLRQLEEAENTAECGSRTQWLYERHNGPR